MTFRPSISHTKHRPSSAFCRRMSLLPSPLKSPVPTACQRFVGGVQPTVPLPVTFSPSISHTKHMPLAPFCRRTSLLPSALKSPVPTARQLFVGGVQPTMPLAFTVSPFISQVKHWPSSPFCRRMSLLPSPLKSPVPTECQLFVGGVQPTPPLALTFSPSSSQTKLTPFAPFCKRMSLWPSASKSPGVLFASGTSFTLMVTYFLTVLSPSDASTSNV